MAKKIVFVVGAGASAEFNIPLGPALHAEIQRDLYRDFIGRDGSSVSGPLRSALMQHSVGGITDEWEEVARRLCNAMSRASTIDNLLYDLRDDPRSVRLGKIAITHHILSGERKTGMKEIGEPKLAVATDALWKYRTACWLGALLVQLIEHRPGADRSTAFDGVTFLTFNYDRCIEFYLLHALRVTLSIPLEEAAAIVRGVPILHAFGHLGTLPALRDPAAFDPDARPPTPFGSETRDLDSVAKGIRTYREESIERMNVGATIHGAIECAERLVFLGFGFNPVNLQLLHSGPLPAGIECYGTDWLSDTDRRGLERFLGRGADPPVFARGCKCVEFIVERGDLFLRDR